MDTESLYNVRVFLLLGCLVFDGIGEGVIGGDGAGVTSKEKSPSIDLIFGGSGGHESIQNFLL